jgi:Type II secretion system (T2SS), protein N
MPTSRSPKRSTKAPLPPQRRKFLAPLIALITLAVLAVVVIALPASLVKRFLPRSIEADDFSGSLWHGSAGKITVNSRDSGAIEWRIHPLSLLTLELAADVHWVMVGFVADAGVAVDRHGLVAHDIQGGGPIEDLSTVGIASGWRGLTSFKFAELKLQFGDGPVTVLSAVGELNVSELSSPQVAEGSDLGGYALRLSSGAVTPAGDATAQLTDTGGPLQVQAEIHYSAKEHTGMLSGTVKERPGAPDALRAQLDQLAQMHARDAEGRLPVDLEFTL